MGNNVAIGGAEWPMNWEMLYDKIIANEMMELEYLGGGFKHFLFSPLFGEDSHFD